MELRRWFIEGNLRDTHFFLIVKKQHRRLNKKMKIFLENECDLRILINKRHSEENDDHPNDYHFVENERTHFRKRLFIGSIIV